MNLSAAAVSELLREDEPPRLLDVREASEWEIARIAGARLVTPDLVSEILDSWPRSTPIVLYCHHGIRSLAATARLRQAGFTNAWNLSGGIEAWSRQVDRDVPRYGFVPGRGPVRV